MRFGFAAAAIFLSFAAPAQAWGPAGHRWVSSIAMEKLPAEVPAFLKTPQARAQIGEIANEPDRWRSSGKTHDAERDAGHFIDLTDDGRVMGVMVLSALPETRLEFDTQLRAGGTDQYKAGYLTYSIVDGFQQLAKDFAYWRAGVVGEKRAATAADRAWFAADRRLRETLIIRDLGVWSHYIGDAVQPHHVTIHADGWGNFPNPQNFRIRGGFHVPFENDFVQANVRRADIAAAVRVFSDCGCPLLQRLEKLLMESHAQVPALFDLEKRGMLVMAPPSREGADFATKQLARGAAEIRDLTVLAWRASGTLGVGYPIVPVADIEAGKVTLTRAMLGGE